MSIPSQKFTLALAITFVLSGCSVMRSYDDELKQTVDLVAQGQVNQALQQLDSNNIRRCFLLAKTSHLLIWNVKVLV